MVQFDPIQATGLLLHVNQERQAFLGSCFAFREDRAFLTAAHCVTNLEPHEVSAWFPGEGSDPVELPIRRMEWIHRHSNADVAILKAAADSPRVEPFWSAVSNYALGEDFMAFGYPENVFGEDARMPTARLFRGHYQRFFEHRSHMGYRYQAGELSITCPPGLSGGPLFRPGAPEIVTALATENFDSTTTLERVETKTEDDQSVEHRYMRVISYGVAVMLDPLSGWLDEHLERFDAGDYAERQRRAVEAERLRRG